MPGEGRHSSPVRDELVAGAVEDGNQPGSMAYGLAASFGSLIDEINDLKRRVQKLERDERETQLEGLRLLTIGDVAQLTRSTTAAIYQWRRRGMGPKGLLVGGKVLFSRQDIEEWLESRAEARK